MGSAIFGIGIQIPSSTPDADARRMCRHQMLMQDVCVGFCLQSGVSAQACLIHK